MLGLPWDRGIKPFFVNEKKVEWYWDAEMSAYAERLGLKGIACVFLREPNGVATRALLDKDTREFLFESQKLETVAAHLDMLKVAEEPKAGKKPRKK
jgi:hypothetical protein